MRADSMSHWFRLPILACLLVGLCACNVSRPNWCQPGTLSYQKSRATYHDPYADNDAGTPVDGGRPRDFENPRSEPVRSAAFRDAFGTP